AAPTPHLRRYAARVRHHLLSPHRSSTRRDATDYSQAPYSPVVSFDPDPSSQPVVFFPRREPLEDGEEAQQASLDQLYRPVPPLHRLPQVYFQRWEDGP
ncbi:unnamed protein product, partial [Musa banksii]